MDDFTVCWLDLSGSGSETAAHVLQNGRLTVMFVALEGPPKILRLYGTGEIIPRESVHLPKFSSIAKIFENTRYFYNIIVIDTLNKLVRAELKP